MEFGMTVFRFLLLEHQAHFRTWRLDATVLLLGRQVKYTILWYDCDGRGRNT
jgi:hypothetical protein